MKILVTGAAGFIGYTLSQRLLERGDAVCGVDNINDYYDVNLKEARLTRLRKHRGFEFQRLDVADRGGMVRLFADGRFEAVAHLAAQAGVRYSLEHPHAYLDSNITGFLTVLEGCRASRVEHLVFASSSSVYGANTRMPLSVHQHTDHPVSLYAATKKANEMMAHSYSHLIGLPCTGLRFFTVYGPWGRPDMALFAFTKAILEGRPVQLYNRGHHRRDFTYVDDVVEGVVRIAAQPAQGDPGWSGDAPDPATSRAPYRLYNIGNDAPVGVLDLLDALERALGKTAIRELVPMQPGDVVETHADVAALQEATGFHPATSVQDGVARFVAWYREYFGLS